MNNGLPRRIRKATNKLAHLRQQLTTGEVSFSKVGEEYRRLEQVIKAG